MEDKYITIVFLGGHTITRRLDDIRVSSDPMVYIRDTEAVPEGREVLISKDAVAYVRAPLDYEISAAQRPGTP